MAFNHEAYNKSFLANPGQNDAGGYGIAVTLVTVPPDTVCFRIIGIHHLTGPENMGNHHVYCDVLDEEGKRINGAVIAFDNNGLIGSVTIDKPDNEPGANIPMNFGDTFNVKASGLASDEAKGFHTRHEDEEPGNTRGHHSFYVVWQRTLAGQDPDPEPTPGLPGWEDKLTLWEQGLVRRYVKSKADLPEAQLIKKLVKVLNGEL